MATATYGPNMDSQLETAYDGDGGTSNLSSVGIVTGKSPYKIRTAMGFDLSALAGATITLATMTITNNNVDVSTPPGCHAYRITESAWVESSSWSYYDYGSTLSWATPGGDYTTTDGVAFTPDGTADASWDITGLDVLVQDAIDNRSGQLLLLLKADSESGSLNTSRPFFTREGTYPPSLYIEYTTAAVPLRPTLVGLSPGVF